MEKVSGDKDDGADATERRKPRRERKEEEVADEKAQTKAIEDAIPGKARRRRGEDLKNGGEGGGGGWLSQAQDNPNKPIPEPTAETEDGAIVT
jgi:hypothetical protein